jgi:hypothetical protein
MMRTDMGLLSKGKSHEEPNAVIASEAKQSSFFLC